MSFLILLHLIFSVNAQEKPKVDMSASLAYEAQIKTNKFKQRLELENMLTSAELQFSVDTFYFNTIYQLKNSTNPCPECIYEHVCELYNKYDSMSIVYEKLILNKLNPNDQIVFRTSVKNWLAFKESEKKLQTVIFKEEYHTGSGVQRYMSALAYLQIAAFRLGELANTYFNITSN